MSSLSFTTGIQHIGIPTNDMDATIKFYETLGFERAFETDHNNGKVIFFRYGSIMLETYEKHGEAAEKRGAVDHIALNVTDLEKTLEEVQKTAYPVIEGPNFLPFFENGVRYFSIMGPNAEVVEFNQYL